MKSGRPVARISFVCLALAASTAFSQASPPTLTGEHFAGVPQVTANCNPDGTSTVTFSVSGVATGPYPGTFTEVGTATIGPQTFDPTGTSRTGALLSFDAVFTIDSPVGDVTGTKTLAFPVTDPATQLATGRCDVVGTAENVAVIARFTVTYEAQINSPLGDFSDRGLVPLVAVQRGRVLEDPIRIFFEFFAEDFASELVVPEPLTTPGKATGGGRIPLDVNFGFVAQSDDKGTKGHCTVIDRTTDTKVKCLDVTMYFQTTNRATFRGNALVNDVRTMYQIDVTDNGESGSGSDTFTISTDSGYTASGLLTQGNIQIHQN